MQSSGGVGPTLPDAEAFASAVGFDFGAVRNGPLEAPRPLLRGGSFSRGFALPMHGPGMLASLALTLTHSHSFTHTLTHSLTQTYQFEQSHSPSFSSDVSLSMGNTQMIVTHVPLCTFLLAYSLNSLTHLLHLHLRLSTSKYPASPAVLHVTNTVSKHAGIVGKAWLLAGTGGFKVNQLPASPFEGARHPSATSASNSSDAPGSGPFGSRLISMPQHSMDTTNSSSGGRQSANQGDPPGPFRGLASCASQKETDPSPKATESPFETLRQQQQQQQVSCRQPIMAKTTQAFQDMPTALNTATTC